MLTKLLSLIAHAKGAAAVTVLVAGAATATVAASTNPDFQQNVTNVTTSLNTTLSSVVAMDPLPAVIEPAPE